MTPKEKVLETLLLKEGVFLRIQNVVGGCTVLVDAHKIFGEGVIPSATQLNDYREQMRFVEAQLIHATLDSILEQTCPLHPDEGQYCLNTGDPEVDSILTSYQQYILRIQSLKEIPRWLKKRK